MSGNPRSVNRRLESGHGELRYPAHLPLTPAEIRQLEDDAEAILRSVSRHVSWLLAQHWRRKRRLSARFGKPGQEREDFSVQVELTRFRGFPMTWGGLLPES